MAAAIGMQCRFQRKALFGAVLRVGLDESEISSLAPFKQAADFRDVGEGMLAELRQNVRVAGGPERRNFRQHRLAKCSTCVLHGGLERRRGARNDAGFREQRQNLAQRRLFEEL